MIQVTRLENSVLFEFSENQHYLYNGSIEVPYNTLSIIQDGSDMITLRKSASNDIFLSARYNDFGEGSVDAAVDMLADSLFNAEGGGGTGSGITSGEVQTMIDNSLDNYYNKAEVNNLLDTKLDASAYTPTDLSSYWTSAQTKNYVDNAISGIPSNILAVDWEDLMENMNDDKWDELVDAFQNNNPIYAIVDYSGEGFIDIDQKPIDGYVFIDGNTGEQGSRIELKRLTSDGYDWITITKNGSNNYTVTNGNVQYQQRLQAGTGIAINGNVISATGGGGISSGEVQTMIDDSLDDYWTSAETKNYVDAATSGIPSSQTIEALRTDVNTLSGDVADINDAIAELDDKEQVIASALTQLRDDMDEKEEVVASALTQLNEAIGDPYQKVSGLTIEYNSDSQTPEIMLQGEGDEQRNENVFNRWGIATSVEMEDGSNYSSSLGGGSIYNGATDFPDDNVTSERDLTISTDGFIQNTYENYDDGESSYTRYSSENEFNYSSGLQLHQYWYDEKSDTETNSYMSIVNNKEGETYIEMTDTNERTVSINPLSVSWDDGKDNGRIEWSNIATLNDIPEYSAGTGIEIRDNVISCTVSGGGNNVIEVTQAQYDALEQAGTLDLTALYVITDASPVSITIDPTLDSGSTNPVANSAITNAITAHTADTTVHVTAANKNTWNGAASNASTAISALGGLRFERIPQVDYDQLVNDGLTDPDTLYIIDNTLNA